MGVIRHDINCCNCGRSPSDFKDNKLRGVGNHCIWCGAMENLWDVACTCGNKKLWYEDELASECPKCGVHSDDFNITRFYNA